MPRVSHHRWTKTTPITLARVVGEENVFVYTSELRPTELDEAITLLKNQFACDNISVRPYTAADADKIRCPNPCCATQLTRVEKHLYEGGKETRAYFRALSRNSHQAKCLFKNPERKMVHRGSWRNALENNKDVVINLDYKYGDTRRPFSYQAADGHLGTAYDHWIRERGRHSYVTHAVHSTQELVEFANDVDRFRGDGGLDSLWVQSNQEIRPYRDTWLAQFDNPDLTESAVSRRILSAVFAKHKNFLCSTSTYTLDPIAQVGPYVTEVDFHSEFNERTKCITSSPVAITPEESAYAVNAYRFNKAPNNLSGRFLIVTCPSVYLGKNHSEQTEILRAMRDTLNGRADLTQPHTFRIVHPVVDDLTTQITRVPTISLALQTPHNKSI